MRGTAGAGLFGHFDVEIIVLNFDGGIRGEVAAGGGFGGFGGRGFGEIRVAEVIEAGDVAEVVAEVRGIGGGRGGGGCSGGGEGGVAEGEIVFRRGGGGRLFGGGGGLRGGGAGPAGEDFRFRGGLARLDFRGTGAAGRVLGAGRFRRAVGGLPPETGLRLL